MLEALRSGASSWVAKGLLALLVVSFAIWGIGSNFISGLMSRTVIEVGDTKISPYEFDRAYRREMNQIRARFGGSIDAETANRLGLKNLTAERLIQGTVLDETTRELGLDVSPEAIDQKIRSNPSFSGMTGDMMAQRLRQQGISVQEFRNDMRREMVRGFLIDSVTAGIDTAPDAIVDPINNYREERRVAEFFEVMNGTVIDLPKASDDDLEKFYKANISRYTKPEYRDLTTVYLSPQLLAADITVPDDEIKQIYEDRIDRYHTPAKRNLEQLVFADEKSAKAAYDKLKGGATMAAVAKEMLDLTATDIDLGKVVKSDLPTDVADKVFALDKDTISEPMKSALGWHIFKVTGISKESTKPLAEVRDSIRSELALKKASDELYQLTANLEDELAGGATMEEAADKINVKPLTFAAVDRNGLGPDGKAVPKLPEAREFLKVAFDTPDGEESALTETRTNAYFIVRVNKIIKSAPQPLADIRDTVLSDWQADQRRKIAGARAKSLAEEISAGKDIAVVAKAEGDKVTRSKPFTRTGTDAAKALSTTAIAALFEAQPGKAIAAPNADGTGHVVARLTLVQQADATAGDAAAKKKIAQDLGRDMAGDILGIYQQALRDKIGVSINRQLIDQQQN